MKASFFALIFMSLAAALYAQPIPAAAQKAFAAQFPTAKHVRWEREKNGDFEAECQIAGVETSVVYSAEGEWKETETEISAKDLPAAVMAAFAKAFPAATLKEAEKIDRNKGETQYEIEFTHNRKAQEAVFSADGSLIK